jgi:hypothetical protein
MVASTPPAPLELPLLKSPLLKSSLKSSSKPSLESQSLESNPQSNLSQLVSAQLASTRLALETQPDLLKAELRAEDVLSFNWRELTALGVAPEQARAIAETLIAKRLMSIYWRKLTLAGVARDPARRIARIIARYDVIEVLPTVQQQVLLSQNCAAICRAGLWRVKLLLSSRE